MGVSSSVLGGVILALALPLPVPAQQHDHDAIGERLGVVEFATSCSADAQPSVQSCGRVAPLLRVRAGNRRIQRDAHDRSRRARSRSGASRSSRWSNPFAAGIRPPRSASAGARRGEPRKGDRAEDRARTRVRRRGRTACTPASRRSTSARACSRTATRWRRSRKPTRTTRRPSIFYALAIAARRVADRQDATPTC